MPSDPNIHYRRSIRLKGYDYTQPGAYWVTMVTQGREPLFGEIVDSVMQLNALGKIIWSVWTRLPIHFSVQHDEWVIMPNHLHGIIFILDDGRGEAFAVKNWNKTIQIWQMLRPNSQSSADDHMGIPKMDASDASPQRAPIGTTPGSLGAIIQNFKSVSTRKINQARDMVGVPVWQRDYYERIVRNEVELAQFRQYIRENPLRWMEDDEYV
jgi:putative transposase